MSFRIAKQHHNEHPTSTPEDQILQHLDDVMSIEQALPKPKVLKSCIRCRKHKTKCDAFDRQPNACSSCSKKGLPCKIDYVLPPQRTDNVKTIVSQVSQMKDEYRKLEMTYDTIFQMLGIQVQSFESWKQAKLSEEDDTEEDEPFCLVKLSDGSFISLNLIDSEKLLINNTVISIPDLESKLKGLVKRLDFMYQVLAADSVIMNYESDSQSQHSSSPNSSMASPHSFTTPATPELSSNSSPLAWFDIDFHVTELFRVNKLLLIMAIAFYYPSEALSQKYTIFLSDYLNSFYQIIETQNKSLNSSTYSNHLLSTIIPGCSVFDKSQLRELVDSEVFNSDVYLKRLTQILFLNVFLFGIDDNLQILTEFIKFVESSINLNRKKINFNKSRDLRFIEGMMRLFGSFTGSFQDSSNMINTPKRRSTSKDYEAFISLLKMDSSMCTHGVGVDGEVTNVQYLKKQFKSWIETWEPYLKFYSAEENVFFDDFTLELMLVNCLILINEGFYEFNTVLVEFLTSHRLTPENENVAQLIKAFKDETVSVNDIQLSCEKMKQIALAIAGKKTGNVIDLKMNDIQVILENVDWKKESTDEVLKKIGVI